MHKSWTFPEGDKLVEKLWSKYTLSYVFDQLNKALDAFPMPTKTGCEKCDQVLRKRRSSAVT